jgi:type VI secretion system protein ImpM
MTTTSAISWYGKLPSAGDFLQRRFPDALQRQWSHWFQVGLLNWQKEQERAADRQFGNAPIWNFVVPPMLGGQQVQMGCLLPGRDSVGRQYPLCALLAINPLEWSPRQLAQSGDWYQQLGRTLLHAMRNSYSAEQLDQSLLSIPTPQPVVEENRSEILDVIGYEGDAAPTLAGVRPRNVLTRCARPVSGGPTVAMAIRSIRMCTAATLPGSFLPCCSIRQAAHDRGVMVFILRCLIKRICV